MKKKILIVLMFCLLITLKEVNANEFASYLPGGKNYFDVNNMIIGDNIIMTEDEMLIKANTEYTLTIPGVDWIGDNINVIIAGQDTYLDGSPDDIATCDVNQSVIVCTFTTTAIEDYLYFEISASMLSRYYEYYQLEIFQLEEGSFSTSYEAYIPPLTDTTTPEFLGAGAYITSYQSNESIATIISEHLIALDDIDGDISDQIIIVSDEYTNNEQTVGEYAVVLKVSDLANNEAFFTLTIIVKDEILPEITGPSIVMVEVTSPPTIEMIIAENFINYDEYDDTLETEIITDEYTLNKTVLGEYAVTYKVTDDALNTVSKTFNVNVVDTTPPQMIGENMHNSYLSNPLLVEDIINSLSFTDNYTNLANVEPTVISDTYTSNQGIPGTYYINIEIEDSSGNILSEVITVNVIDDIAPSIGGPINYSGSYDLGLTITDFLNMLSVSDNVDSLTNSDIYIISDTYTSRTTEIGDFVIIFGVKDFNNNEYTHQIEITLFDGVAPVIYVDNYIVTVNLSATFNEEDALKLLLNSNELEAGNYTITTLIDEYTGNEKLPGAYLYRLAFTSENGDVFEKEFLVKVEDTNHLTIDKDLLGRNIVLYSSVAVFFTVILIKRKKSIALITNKD